MIRSFSLSLALLALLTVGAPVIAAESLGQSRGFYLSPSTERSGGTPAGVLAPIQAFELVRPGMDAFRVGRIYTSCPCVELVSDKRAFTKGERAYFEARNVKATPPSGHTYALYVQITSPVKTTVRYDIFMRSSQFIPKPIEEVMAAREKEEAETKKGALTKKDEDKALVEKVKEKAAAALGTATETASGAYAATRNKVRDLVGRDKDKDKEMDPYRARSEPDDFGRDGTLEGSDIPPFDEETGQYLTEKEDETAPAAKEEAEEAEEAEKPAAVEDEADLPPYAVDSNVTLLTLGVADLDRSRKFYEALGWKAIVNDDFEDSVFFQLNGQILALYPMTKLLEDQARPDARPVSGGVALGINVADRRAVTDAYLAFIEAGASSLKTPAATPWGGTACFVADPDGHPWEISWIPQMTVDENGKLWIK